ncbi:putative pyruvate dehydrogenase (acetyl-transferring) [Helianthus anomalus]
MDDGSNRIGGRADQLVTNAVAVSSSLSLWFCRQKLILQQQQLHLSLGEHVTILTYSRMRYHVMQAAKTLVNKGFDPETHRVLIVEECMRTGGMGASLTAAITENFHDYLDAPIVCLSSQDVPTPYAGTLEEWTVVQPPQIVAAVEQLCR